MTKFQMTRPNAPWDYPTLGFVAEVDGAILDGSLSTPPITAPPDAYWAVYGGGSAETDISRYARPTTVPPAEPNDGSMLIYSDSQNTYVPASPADIVEALGTDLSASYGHPVSTDGTDGLPAPSGVGLELVISAAGLDDIRMNGVSL